MEHFMIAYHGGSQPKSKEESMAQMEKWKNWIAGLGETVINPGTPLPVSKLITSSSVKDDQNPHAMKGFAIVQAENIEEAIAIAKTDPFLQNGGTIRVSHMMKMT